MSTKPAFDESLYDGNTMIPMGTRELVWLELALKKLGFFSQMRFKDLAEILPHMSLVNLPKGHAVCREGDKGDSFYLIYRGEVEVTKKGWERPVAKLGPGEFFGEMALLFGEPRSATVTALKEGQAFVLRQADFDRILKHNATVAKRIRQVAEERRKELARQ